MIDALIQVGTQSKRIFVFLKDSSSTTGAGLTGLVYNSTNLTCYYSRDDDGNAGANQVVLATATRGSWATAGFIEKDATNMPGVYEFGIPNAILLAGSKQAKIMFFDSGFALNLVPCVIDIELTGFDPFDAVRLGLTALPNANAAATGGLPTVDASNAVKVQSGTSANQISLSAGLVSLAASQTANITGNITGNLSGSVGSVTGAVGSVTGAVGSVTGAVGSVTGNVGGNVVGSVASVTGAVGSVTGAVGSVTGNVGGNVVGSVASVTGAVGSVTGNVGGNVVGSVASVTADVGITQAGADKVFGAGGAAMAELAQAQPAATPSPGSALMLLYMSLRNALSTTSTTKSINNNAGTVIAKKTLADDGTTYSETKMVSGP